MNKRSVLYTTVLIGVLLVVGLVGAFKINTSEVETPRGALFLTVGLNQTALPNETSSYEIHRATEHFANIILGWTIEPAFSADFKEELQDVSYTGNYSGRLQEKQNLLFIFSEYSEPAIQALQGAIEERIGEYNAATNSAYVLAVKRSSELPPVEADTRVLLGILLLAGLFTVLFLMSWEYVFSTRSRS